MKTHVWLALGDSITEKNQRTEKNYHLIVKEKLGNLEVINAGEGGTGFRHHHKTRPPFYKRIERYKDYPIDFITILGGINDLMLDDGYIGKAGDSSEDSYMGCLNILIKKIETLFPGVPYAFISTVPQEGFIPTDPNNKLETLVSEMAQYAKDRNIPFLDILHDSPLKPWEKDNNKKYYSNPEMPDGDGLHPNLAGHMIMAEKITPFVKKIVEKLENKI